MAAEPGIRCHLTNMTLEEKRRTTAELGCSVGLSCLQTRSPHHPNGPQRHLKGLADAKVSELKASPASQIR